MQASTTPRLPAGVSVFERGWLSSNSVLLQGVDACALVDSGYCTHAEQTVLLVQQALGRRPLDLLVNTHLHSDHCGGNAALQLAFPAVQTLVPPGHSAQVRHWDPEALTYGPTGQSCPRFELTAALRPGDELVLGDLPWQVHSAPGHDPHAVVFFEPQSRLLLSADALWQNGFGVVFPELEGATAFDEVAATLDLIETLDPLLVIPGHGAIFDDVAHALRQARRRLESFVQDPARHATHAAKVLLKFKLLEQQHMPRDAYMEWAAATAYFQLIHTRYFRQTPFGIWVEELTDALVKQGALLATATEVRNA